MTTLPALAKSEKGLAELASGAFGLDLKARQVLILADGRRTLQQLQQLRPGLDVASIVQRLGAEGYLTGVLAAATPVASTQAIAASATLAPETLAQVQAIIIDSTRSHLGLLGGDLIRKVQAARSLEQLKGCIAQWNMALRDSRLGRAVADQYLCEVQLVMASPP